MERLITTIKNMTEKNKFKSLTRFHSANNTDNYNRGGKTGGGGRENPRESTEQVKT